MPSETVTQRERTLIHVSEGPSYTNADPRDIRIVELQQEVDLLRARVAKLETEKADLLRASIERQYERPPHYR